MEHLGSTISTDTLLCGKSIMTYTSVFLPLLTFLTGFTDASDDAPSQKNIYI